MEMSEEEFLALVERRRERKASNSSDDASQLSLKRRARTHMEDAELREHQAAHTVRAERNRSRSRRR